MAAANRLRDLPEGLEQWQPALVLSLAMVMMISSNAKLRCLGKPQRSSTVLPVDLKQGGPELLAILQRRMPQKAETSNVSMYAYTHFFANDRATI
mmetsp:Transcript_40863/g.89417  ORF Transcript_40863/g.89417 Transcript_40863/m.89417 type:complete len:95 (+) Transcript_40863:802-1086(+)